MTSGREDEHGWYYVVDRAKDMIIQGGYNVYPREVEEVLRPRPMSAQAAVIGQPTRATVRGQGRRRPHTAGATVTEDELVAWGEEPTRRLQVPKHRRVRRRAADDRDGQDPKARARLMRGPRDRSWVRCW